MLSTLKAKIKLNWI